MTGWFFLWVFVTQLANAAFYLAVTRAVRGWWRTVVVYSLGYLLPLFVLLCRYPNLHGELDGGAGRLPYSFMLLFVFWAAVTVAMSSGSFGRRLFSTLVCGVHQIGAFSFSLLSFQRLDPGWNGAMIGCAIMLLMGWLLVRVTLPKVRQIPSTTPWRYLNMTGIMNFALLYAVGLWPTYMPTGTSNDIFTFIIANALAIVFFPAALAFAETSHEAATVSLVERNMRHLSEEIGARRQAIDEARRIRHDHRHHRIAVCGLLLQGKAKEALAYLRTLDEDLSEATSIPHVWCENETVNAILSGFERKARAANVRFSAVANVRRQSVLPEIESVAVIANVLENALIAASKVKDGEIVCALRHRDDSIGLTVTNTVSSDFRLTAEGLPCDKLGIGLESVFRIVEKHAGDISYSAKKGVVTCQIVIFEGGGLNENCAL